MNVRLAYEPIDRARTTQGRRSKLPPPHDAYLAADLITYPSLYEGFGNALIEAVFYGIPVLVNRYPVYDADIRPLGLRFVKVDGAITEETVAEVRKPSCRTHAGSDRTPLNFDVGRDCLSLRLSACAVAWAAPPRLQLKSVRGANQTGALGGRASHPQQRVRNDVG